MLRSEIYDSVETRSRRPVAVDNYQIQLYGGSRLSGPESVGGGLSRLGSKSLCLWHADKKSTGVVHGSQPDADGEGTAGFQGKYDSWA